MISCIGAADDIVQWMNVKAFGTPRPAPDARLTGSGSSSLEFMKKALSFYMPNKESWDKDEGGKGGNPTRSRQVKAFMQHVVALGGERKRMKVEEDAESLRGINASAAEGGGPRGLLRRTHTQNADFINILDTMGSALRTFSQSIDQMKSALETNNIAIRHELSKESLDSGGDGDDDAYGEMADEAIPDVAEEPDIPKINVEMKEEVAKVTETVEEFINSNVTANEDLKISSGADGFCTFTCDKTGRHTDVPDGFVMPSCNLFRAWRHWITGFPDFKMHNDNDEVIDAPIRPLRFISTSHLPQSLKKKFKDGWKPILMSMQGDVAEMLDATPVSAMDERFVRDSYDLAMEALLAKAPDILDEAGSDRYGSWKVSTWSRKIREQQLGQQQVRRRREQRELAWPSRQQATSWREEPQTEQSLSKMEEREPQRFLKPPTLVQSRKGEASPAVKAAETVI